MAIRAFHLFGEIDLKNKVSADLHKVDRDFHRTTKNFGSLKSALSSPISLSGVNSVLGTLGNISNTIQGIPVLGNLISGALSTVTGPIKDLAQLGLGFNDLKENATLAFSVILKDGEKAKKLFADLEKFGVDSPIFKTGDLVGHAQKFLPYTGAGPELFSALKGAGALAAVTGDMGNLPSIVKAFQQIALKPKLTAEEPNQQLGDAGVDFWGLLARARGQTKGEVQELTSKGMLSGMGAFTVVLEQANREFGSLVDLMGQTRTGKQAQIDDKMEQVAARGTTSLHGTWKNVQDRMIAGLNGPQAGALADQINATTGDIGGKVLGGFDALMDGSLLGRMQQAGEDAKAGISKGFEGVKTGVGNAVEYVTGFKTGIGANSPATEFISLGQDAAAGFLIGFETQMIASGAPMSLFQSKGVQSLTGGNAQAQRRAENEALLKHPAIQAMMDAIGVGEGTFNPRTGEREWMRWFGNAPFTPGPEHPGISPVPFFNRATGQRDRSSAAGGGQFLQRTWSGVEQDIGNLDFNNLYHQALAFVEKMRDRGMIAPLLRGDVRTAMSLGNEEWASLPGSPHKQPTVKEGTVIDTFSKQLGVYANGASASITNPMPVTIVAGVIAATGQAAAMAGPSGQAGLIGSNAQALQAVTAAQQAITAAGVTNLAKQVQDVANNPEAVKGMKLATEATQGVEAALNKAVPAIEKLGGAAELTAEQIAANRKLSDLQAPTSTAATAAREKSLTWGNAAGDFQGGLQGLLANLGWQPAGSLGKQFLLGMVQNIQGRLASDFSEMITGSLFGNIKTQGGPMTGGLLQRLFGGLFGGGRASGGSVSAGRLYMVGEQGPELLAMGGSGGHVYNQSQTRGMMGGGEQRTIVAFGDREIGRATEAYGNTSRGRRARIMHARYMRKISSVSYG